MCGSIPNYWGAANIEEYFDTKGMYVCDSFADIMAIFRRLPVEIADAMRQATQHSRQ